MKTNRITAINLLLMPLFFTLALGCLLTACGAQDTTQSPATPASRSAKPTMQSSPVSKAMIPLTTISMQDEMHGWALTKSAILMTADGGTHWKDVTPPNAVLNEGSKGTFLNNQTAIIAVPQSSTGSIGILRTLNAGKDWSTSTISSQLADGLDMPHFLDASHGWLQVYGQPGAGNLPSAVFHTTDGGQHWTTLNNTYGGASGVIRATGISFHDQLNGWVTGDGGPGGAHPSIPRLSVTHDGGKTWQSVTLPAIPGEVSNDLVVTKPPVIFGDTGLLPVTFQNKAATYLYVTHDGGKTWASRQQVAVNATFPTNALYIADQQHAWAAGEKAFYATTDGGQTWSNLAPITQPIGVLNFSDANNGWAVGPRTSQGDTTPLAMLLHTIDGGKTWQSINYTIQ